jgi:hypothetical protein
MNIIINPGTGPVAGSNEEDATANMVVFAEEVATKYGLVRVREDRAPANDYDGRFAYRMIHRDADGNDHVQEIDLPGLPLHQVNYGARPDDNPWHFPRLYVDGSSWLWSFAIGVCGPESEDDV